MFLLRPFPYFRCSQLRQEGIRNRTEPLNFWNRPEPDAGPKNAGRTASNRDNYLFEANLLIFRKVRNRNEWNRTGSFLQLRTSPKRRDHECVLSLFLFYVFVTTLYLFSCFSQGAWAMVQITLIDVHMAHFQLGSFLIGLDSSCIPS